MTDPRQLDVRTVHRYIQKGALTRQAFEAALAELPDLQAEAEFVDYENKLTSASPEDSAPASGATPDAVPVFVDGPNPPARAPLSEVPAPVEPPPAAPPAGEGPPPSEPNPEG